MRTARPPFFILMSAIPRRVASDLCLSWDSRMGRGLGLALLLFLGIATGAGAAPPLTINISAGHDRGRFGDIAASLLLAEQLQRIQAADEIRLIIQYRDTHEKMRILVPELRALKDDDPQLQTGELIHKGVRIFLYPKQIPKADYAFYFSTDHLRYQPSKLNLSPFPLRQSATETLLFQELSDERYSGDLQSEDTADSILELATGIRVNRLYIDPEKPATPLRGAVFHQLKKEFEESWKLDPSPRDRGFQVNSSLEAWLNDPTVLIAICYAQSDTLRKTYRQALARLLSREENRGKRILLLKNQPNQKRENRTVPDNSRILRAADFTPFTGWSLERKLDPNGAPLEMAELTYSEMSFELSQKLMAISDLPPLVTGDVSAALALNSEKPYFYEIMSWKTGSQRALFWNLLSHSARHRLDFPTAYHLSLMHENYPIAKHWERIMSNSDFLKRISQGMGRLRKNSSLAERIKRYVRRSPAHPADCRSYL